MRLTETKCVSIVCALVIAACGGGGDGPGGLGGFPAEDRGGDGSGTLAVEVRIDASPLADELASSADAMSTRFQVDVRDSSGADVSGATVVIDSPRGAVTLAEGGCERRYCGSQPGYAGVYEISITRGADFVDGIVVHGPALHQVTAPAHGATIDASLPLEVRWSPSGEADAVRVETRDATMELAGDPGVVSMAAGVLRTRTDGLEDERVRVRRERRLAIAGALPSTTSSAVVEVRNGIELTTMAAP